MYWAYTAQDNCSERGHMGQTQKNKDTSMFIKLKCLVFKRMYSRYHHIRKGKTWLFKRKPMVLKLQLQWFASQPSSKI